MNQSPQKPKVWLMALYPVLALACFAGACISTWNTYQAYAVAYWPTAKGKILSSELKSEFVGKMKHTAKIEYEFEVDGQVYRSSSIRVRGESNQHKVDIEPMVKKYPKGKAVKVFYKQQDPSICYLEVGIDFVYFIGIFGPLLFACVFGSLFWEKYKLLRAK